MNNPLSHVGQTAHPEHPPQQQEQQQASQQPQPGQPGTGIKPDASQTNDDE